MRLQIINIVGFLIMIAINVSANIIPINGVTQADISDAYPNLFTPTGFTFSIWGVIYLMLFAFCIYQGRDLFKAENIEMPFIHKIGWLFFISSILNATWIFAWHYMQIPLSMLIMVLLLLSLIGIYLRLGIGQTPTTSQKNYWVRIPFRLYLGWITVATIANAVILSKHLNWSLLGLTETCWTIILIGAAAIITVSFLKFREDLVFSLVVLWALFGIVFERLTAEPVIMPVVIAAIAAMIGIAGYGAVVLTHRSMEDEV